ncbi:MAG: hypothetical protein WAZ98_03850 [Cyclobacteriaceae bacterium]
MKIMMASLTELYSQVAPVIPPDNFYYILFLLLGAGLIWVIKVYINRTDETLKQITTSVSNMDKLLAIHEHKHEQHEKEIAELKESLKKG